LLTSLTASNLIDDRLVILKRGFFGAENLKYQMQGSFGRYSKLWPREDASWWDLERRFEELN